MTNMSPEEIIAAVNEYEQQGSGQKGSQTLQVRRIIKALTLIGLKRSEFRARVERESYRGRDGSRVYQYGNALGSIRTERGEALVIEHAQTLKACGISVHIFERGAKEGRRRWMAFVSTSYPFRVTRTTLDGERTYE